MRKVPTCDSQKIQDNKILFDDRIKIGLQISRGNLGKIWGYKLHISREQDTVIQYYKCRIPPGIICIQGYKLHISREQDTGIQYYKCRVTPPGIICIQGYKLHISREQDTGIQYYKCGINPLIICIQGYIYI